MRFSYYVDGDLDFLDDEEEEDESVPSDDRSQEEMKAAPHKRASRIVYSQKTKDDEFHAAAIAEGESFHVEKGHIESYI